MFGKLLAFWLFSGVPFLHKMDLELKKCKYQNCWMAIKTENNMSLIYVQNFPKPPFTYFYFILLSVCTFWILSSSRRYSKCILLKATRRVSKTSPKIFWEVNHQVIPKTSTMFPGSSPAEHHQDVELLQNGTSAWDSCLISSFTHPIRLREFCYASSSTSDEATGVIPTRRQLIIVWSKWWQRIIITFPAPNADMDIQKVWPAPFLGLTCNSIP